MRHVNDEEDRALGEVDEHIRHLGTDVSGEKAGGRSEKKEKMVFEKSDENESVVDL